MKLLKRTVWVCIVLFMLCAMWRLLDRSPPSSAVTNDTGLMIEKITGLSSLATLKEDVADAVVSDLSGRTGKVRAVLIVKGDVTLGVDLSTAVFEHIDAGRRHVVLRLRYPTVQSVRLDHERTKLLGVWENGLWIIVPGGGDADTATVNQALRDAQRIVAAAGQGPELIQQCRLQTEQVLRTFLRALGWEVEMRWST